MLRPVSQSFQAIGEICQKKLRAEWASEIARIWLIPLASILMNRSPWVGAAIWVTLFQTPRMAVTAFLSLGLIELTLFKISTKTDDSFDASLRANTVLSALAAAWLVAPKEIAFTSELVFVLAAMTVGAVLTLIVQRLVQRTNLPPLAWGYCLLSGILFVVIPEGGPQSSAYFNWPVLSATGLHELPTAFLSAMGTLLFSPWVYGGLVIGLAVLLWSPAMFAAGCLGWLAGALASLSANEFNVTLSWVPASYNFVLAGMALGAVFFLPGWRGLVLAAVAGTVSSLLVSGFAAVSSLAWLAYLPIPFCITVWAGIIALSNTQLSKSFKLNSDWTVPPEEAWLKQTWEQSRWSDGTGFLAVPVLGPVEITQGFDGDISHRGAWKHGLDFQRPEILQDGLKTRPSIWDYEIYSPVEGIVERLQNNVQDNPVGVANYSENWGNSVVIRMDGGGFAQLSHLRSGSIAVSAGQRVDYTTYLGRVGNSGRSTVPHLHLQVQDDGNIGAKTSEFRLANYLSYPAGDWTKAEWHAAGIPHQGDIVYGARPNPAVRDILVSIGAGRSIWTATVKGDVPPECQQTVPIVLNVSLTETGLYLFSINGRSNFEVRSDPDAWRVVGCSAPRWSFLGLLALSAPTVPFCTQAGLRWRDRFPVLVRPDGRNFSRSFAPFGTDAMSTINCRCTHAPDALSHEISIESQISGPDQMPGLVSLTCSLSALRGPHRLTVRFENGEITYEARSFEPTAGRAPVSETRPAV